MKSADVWNAGWYRIFSPYIYCFHSVSTFQGFFFPFFFPFSKCLHIIAPKTTISANGSLSNITLITVEVFHPWKGEILYFDGKELLDETVSESSLGFSDIQEMLNDTQVFWLFLWNMGDTPLSTHHPGHLSVQLMSQCWIPQVYLINKTSFFKNNTPLNW